MRQLWLVVALAGTGCNQLLGIDELTRVDGGTGTIDSSMPLLDSPEGMTCAMLVSPAACAPSSSTAVSIVGLVNTDGDSRCTVFTPTTGPALCVISGGTIMVPGPGATITGSRPLLLIATTTITVTGALDASSTNKDTPRTGPGASSNPPDCLLPTPGGGGDGEGGGAGGSFGTKGGDGGDGGGSGGHAGAAAASALEALVIRAGCRGSDGGGGAADLGPGGPGGGAIYAVAGTEILIANHVRANGAAGIGATRNQSGGGGGGSGGMIVLDAPAITLGPGAQIYANGAGGGEGTVLAKTGDGNESMAWNVAATGGSLGSALGGDGGIGAAAAAAGLDARDGTSGGGNEGGGGGGGGGGGVVWIKGTVSPSLPGPISPSPIAKN